MPGRLSTPAAESGNSHLLAQAVPTQANRQRDGNGTTSRASLPPRGEARSGSIEIMSRYVSRWNISHEADPPGPRDATRRGYGAEPHPSITTRTFAVASSRFGPGKAPASSSIRATRG